MRTLNDLLLTIVETGATDLHLIVGKVPTVRIEGIIVPVEGEPELAGDRFVEMLDGAGLSSGDDTLYVIEDPRHRFRVSVFDIGEGLVARLIPEHIPPLRISA